MEAVGGLAHAGAHGLGQGCGQGRVDLDGPHARADFKERKRQGAEARADLNDLVALFDATGCDDLAHRARVVHEVLAQYLGGADTERLGDGLDFEGAEQARLGGDGALGQGRVEAAARVALVAGAGGSAHAGKSSARGRRGRVWGRCEARSVTGRAEAAGRRAPRTC